MLCAVLVREPLWLEARMDDQALLEGIVVFSDEGGPANQNSQGLETGSMHTDSTVSPSADRSKLVCSLPLFLSLR